MLRTYSVPFFTSQTGGTYEGYYNQWERSGRVAGKLKLTAHAHEFQHTRVTAYSSPQGKNFCGAAESVGSFPFTTSHSNEVYGKFVGKLRYGDADLGVSFASWHQTSDMMVDRFQKLQDFFSLKRASRRKSRRRPKREDRFQRDALARDVLEGEFGWLPLVGDIYAGLVTACGANAVPSTWVHASSRFSNYSYSDSTMVSNPRRIVSLNQSGRITYAAACVVTNPNLWLLNRLGLINPLTVAWDLVRWSFVVNMFVNINQIIGSLTDTVGLTLSQCTQTKSSRTFREEICAWHSGVLQNHTSTCNAVGRFKSRTAGPLPSPSLALKAPKLDWNLALIASALTVSKVKAFH